MSTLSATRRTLRFVLRAFGLTLRGLLRGVLLVLALALLAAGGLLWYFRTYFDEEKARGLAAAAIEDVLRRPVRVEKAIVTPRGVKLVGLRVFGRDQSLSETLLTSDSALVTFKLLPLAMLRLELDRVKLVSPSIWIIREPGGRWNIEDLLSRPRAAAGEPSGAPLRVPVALAAEKTVIENGRLLVDDRAEGRRYSVDRFNMLVEGFDPRIPFPVTVSFSNTNVLGDRTLDGRAELSGTLYLADWDWPQASWEGAVDVAIDGRPIRGRLRVQGFPGCEIDAELRLPPLGPAEWARYLGRDLKLAVPAGALKARVQVTEPRKLRLEAVSLAAGDLDAALTGFAEWGEARRAAELKVTLKDFPLEKAAAFLPSLARFKLKGTVLGTASGSLEPRGWRTREAVVRAKGLGWTAGDVSFSSLDLTLAASSGFDRVTLSAARGAIRAFGHSFSDVDLSVKYGRPDLRLEKASLRWAGSPVRLKARVRDVYNLKEVMITSEMEEVRWEKAQDLVESLGRSASGKAQTPEDPAEDLWLRRLKRVIPRKFPDTIGRLAVKRIIHEHFDCSNLEVLWSFRGVSPSLRYVSGDFKFGFGPGRVSDIPKVQQANDTLRVIFLPFVYMHKMNSLAVLSARTAYPKTLDFSRIEGEYGLRHGSADIRYFSVESPQLVAFADGSADFNKETVDMRFLTRLTQYRGQLPEWWVDEAGRPAIAFRVKGAMADSDVEPRLSKIAANEIEAAKEAGMGRARAESRMTERLREL